MISQVQLILLRAFLGVLEIANPCVELVSKVDTTVKAHIAMLMLVC